MTHWNRWDQWDQWDKRPIRPAAYLIVALVVAFTWGVMAGVLASPSDPNLETHVVDKTSPILFGAKTGSAGGGDENFT